MRNIANNKTVFDTFLHQCSVIIPSLRAISLWYLYKKDRRGSLDLWRTTIVVLKCGKKRLLYSENEESVVHSWRETQWGENERERKSEIYARPCMNVYELRTQKYTCCSSINKYSHIYTYKNVDAVNYVLYCGNPRWNPLERVEERRVDLITRHSPSIIRYLMNVNDVYINTILRKYMKYLKELCYVEYICIFYVLYV